MIKILILSISSLLTVLACDGTKKIDQPQAIKEIQENSSKAHFASGCFWCVEAIYESITGVHEVISGYAEGSEENARYDRVSAGITKHVEAVEVIYDPKLVSYQTLVEVFFGSGDPTTLNQQGPDRGYQYRSAIYYHNDDEKRIAHDIKMNLESKNVFNNPIVTDILQYSTFFPAEDYHQNYEKRNPTQGYIRAVSIPRLNRFKKAFPDLLKKEH